MSKWKEIKCIDVRKSLLLKRYARKVISLCMVTSMLVGTIIIRDTVSAASPSGSQIGTSDYLKSEGGYMKNQNNQVVGLRGVNFGGWLIQESWMCPVNGADRAWANLDSLNALKNRGFSEVQIEDLFNTYQQNWITATDFDNLKAMNVNCVRVPFWYRNFMIDEAGTWMTNDINTNPGIQKLDYVIQECGKRGIYVILDCHGAPGGQSMDHSTGTLAKNELYDSATNRAIFADMWTKIATRYKDSPVVAAYDIMNEPQNNSGYSGPNAWAPGSAEALSRTYSVYDQIYKVIRAVDTRHVISMEAIWAGTCLPDPATYGWTNLMYQMHIYDNSLSMIDTRINELIGFQTKYGVAAYAGEFNCDPNEEYAMSKLNQAGIGWTSWAYKGSKQSPGNNWFLYVAQTPVADTTVDSYDTIKAKWGSPIQTNAFTTNTVVYNWINNHTNDPVPNNVSAPTFSPTAGMITGATNVTISSATSGATIKYTKDGSDPKTSNTAISSTSTVTINVTQNTTFNAYTLKSGMTDSATVTATYFFPKPASWFQNFEAGTGFTAGTSATVSSYGDTALTGGKSCIKLTTSVTGEPNNNLQCANITPQIGTTVDSTGYDYFAFYIKDTQGSNTNKITMVDASGASWNGWLDIKSVQNQWTKIAMPMNMVSGINKAAINQVRIGEWNTGTYYIDDTYFAQIATDPNPAFSAVTQVATPTFNPAGGTYTAAQNVILSSVSSGATIRYTTDGTAPTVTSPVYSTPINVATTETIKAYATASGLTDSAVTSATYTISALAPFKWAFEDSNASGTWNWSSTWNGGGTTLAVGSYNDLPCVTTEKYEGTSSIMFNFNHAGGAGNAGGSITTIPGGTGVEPTSQAERDAGKNVSSYSKLEFYIKGDTTSKARIKIRDTAGNETSPIELTSVVTPSSTWQLVSIPYTSINWGSVNKASITEVKFLIDANTYAPGTWTFYIDNLQFTP